MPKAETESAEARRTSLKAEVKADCEQMASFRAANWGPEMCDPCREKWGKTWVDHCTHQRPWTNRRMLECMIETYQENHRDDPNGGWDKFLDVAHELRRETGARPVLAERTIGELPEGI